MTSATIYGLSRTGTGRCPRRLVGQGHRAGCVFEALLSVPDAVEEITDRYAAAAAGIYGADEPDGEP